MNRLFSFIMIAGCAVVHPALSFALDGSERATDKGEKVLRIASYNVGVFGKTEESSIDLIAGMMKELEPDMIANNLTPAYPTHPGSILKDEIEYRGITQHKLAQQMGVPYSALNEILNGKRPLTEKMVLLFEAILGIDAEPLLALQTDYNLRKMRKDSSFMERLTELRKIASLL